MGPDLEFLTGRLLTHAHAYTNVYIHTDTLVCANGTGSRIYANRVIRSANRENFMHSNIPVNHFKHSVFNNEREK